MSIQLLALLLLIGRIVSDFFIILVLRRQWKLRKTKTHPKLTAVRKVLGLLAILVFLGNIWPLVLDAFTLFYPGIRSTQHVNFVGLTYSLDNNLTFMFASILIYALYRLSDTVIEVVELLGVEAAKPEVSK